MRILKPFILSTFVGLFFMSCFEDRDDHLVTSIEIKDFVWKGMNAFYLYKDAIPNLANDRFSSNTDYNAYLNGFSSPEELFESVIYERETIDRFSVIVDDYIALEQLFDGVTKNNGMEFGLVRFNSTDTNLFGYVRYVLPNTDAEVKNVQRGDLFYAVNGTQLTVNNYRSLLGSDSYTINLGTYDDNGTPQTITDDAIIPSTENIVLTKFAYTENPIFIHNILNVDGNNVGYLMYNGFVGTDQFDSQLNSVFGEFMAAGITDLILDLRYNGGGSVRTATWLASMITGNFTGQTFFSEQYNSEIQAQFIAEDPSLLLNPFVDEMIKKNSNGNITFQQTVNHVNLNKVYVLTTRSTASASELVINGLDPYIDVIKIGKTTTGKYQASITVYDAPNFDRAEANPNHTYALQPLIYKSLNVDGVTDYFTGFEPDILLNEDYSNLGVLGDINEPYLAAAIANIQGTGRISNGGKEFNDFKDNKDFDLLSKFMYSEKTLPIFQTEN